VLTEFAILYFITKTAQHQLSIQVQTVIALMIKTNTRLQDRCLEGSLDLASRGSSLIVIGALNLLALAFSMIVISAQKPRSPLQFQILHCRSQLLRPLRISQ
jgi:hypothetical protein